MTWQWQHTENLTYLTVLKWVSEGIDIGFSTRLGGESSFPYDSFNLGLHVGDDSETVLKNRKDWFNLWGVPWNKVVVGEQVHGNHVSWVKDQDGGRGAKELVTAVSAVDGLITQNAIGLMAFFADCVPLYFYYPDIKAVGIAHAGWKGTVNKIGQMAIECFEEAGGRTEKAWVAIGPSIGPCCYSIDERVAEQFRSNFEKTPFLFPQEDGHYFLDLWEANRVLLLEKGIRPENIDIAAICTADNPKWFYSHRRDGALTGRMAGWIRMRKSR
ncbi:uncharacterized protein, YfiH family [Desulfosporosinus orientis DSM 765]|uniref:Purine nucleoside phosphorylase n=1 Tax=Desulfosporosinus orientis (strain ATCC 19365 / DSM 765 / NCIMB 8382 / VKM B-1628 / Singapore I) TaxID=768706 RepID=G7WHB6_DESOD|nr:peptidoglycan editing factor PgeF [Desulfosporosinus orientis]AET70206.1 uncharacterized protein, YfiH family [Desulfosporosinus orientis DSM 765]